MRETIIRWRGRFAPRHRITAEAAGISLPLSRNYSGRAMGKGEVLEILTEIENILKKIEGTRLSNLNDNLSTRLETIERKLGDLESMLSRIGPHYSSAQLNNLIEEIVTSRIRSDLESSVQALHLLQASTTARQLPTHRWKKRRSRPRNEHTREKRVGTVRRWNALCRKTRIFSKECSKTPTRRIELR